MTAADEKPVASCMVDGTDTPIYSPPPEFWTFLQQSQKDCVNSWELLKWVAHYHRVRFDSNTHPDHLKAVISGILKTWDPEEHKEWSEYVATHFLSVWSEYERLQLLRQRLIDAYNLRESRHPNAEGAPQSAPSPLYIRSNGSRVDIHPPSEELWSELQEFWDQTLPALNASACDSTDDLETHSIAYQLIAFVIEKCTSAAYASNLTAEDKWGIAKATASFWNDHDVRHWKALVLEAIELHREFTAEVAESLEPPADADANTPCLPDDSTADGPTNRGFRARGAVHILTETTLAVVHAVWQTPSKSLSFEDFRDTARREVTNRSAERVRRNFNKALSGFGWEMSLAREHFTIREI